MKHGRWIVVGTDFSEGAECALDHAIRLGGRAGARIALVHAYEDQLEDLSSGQDRAPELRAQLDDAIARVGEKGDGDGASIEGFLRRGAPWEKLLNLAVEVGADLIVVGATGQRGAIGGAGSLLGSVAYRVVSSSTRSVLISRIPLDRGSPAAAE
jgi:nucleotide-binding universal stress UspA family protein